jgi:hypothetical protein
MKKTTKTTIVLLCLSLAFSCKQADFATDDVAADAVADTTNAISSSNC